MNRCNYDQDNIWAYFSTWIHRHCIWIVSKHAIGPLCLEAIVRLIGLITEVSVLSRINTVINADMTDHLLISDSHDDNDNNSNVVASSWLNTVQTDRINVEKVVQTITDDSETCAIFIATIVTVESIDQQRSISVILSSTGSNKCTIKYYIDVLEAVYNRAFIRPLVIGAQHNRGQWSSFHSASPFRIGNKWRTIVHNTKKYDVVAERIRVSQQFPDTD
jgi:hypothetical protein